MPRRPIAAALPQACRRLASLALAGVLLLAAPGPAPARAEHEPGHEPVARLQLWLKDVYIYDDNDPGWLLGAGEMRLTVHFPGGYGRYDFEASGGQTKPLDRLAEGDHYEPAVGFAVYAGERYLVNGFMEEMDDVTHWDHMGWFANSFGEQDGWGMGTHKVRSHHADSSGPTGPGDFELTFEIRRAPVPDLNPTRITIYDPNDGPDSEVCIGVVNREAVESGNFWVQLKVGEDVPRNGNFYSRGLAAGEVVDICIRTDLPTTGSHKLTAIVDERREVAEYNEANNRIENTYLAHPTIAAPTPTTGPAQADLLPRSIRIRGDGPGGSDDCDPGRNDVTVIAKNDGTAAAGSFAVRLVVDGEDDEAKEKTVPGLEAGKELEITFDDVRLRRGMRTLEAVVDAKKAVAESNENNNELTVTVDCRNEG